METVRASDSHSRTSPWGIAPTCSALRTSNLTCHTVAIISSALGSNHGEECLGLRFKTNPTCRARVNSVTVHTFASLETGSSHTKAIATTSIFCSPMPNPSKARPLHLILFVALQINFMIGFARAELFYPCLLVYPPDASFITPPLL